MAPARKKTKKSKEKQPVTAQNSTGQLAHLPFDILFEIFNYLHPLDLLHISRVSKPFWSFLSGRSSIPVWRMAFASIPDFPPCPEYLTAPRYAHLAFEEICDICFNTTTYAVIWEFRARYCSGCKPSQLRTCIPASLRKHDAFDFDGVFPTINSRFPRRYHKYEIEAFADVFVSLESTEDKLLAIQNQQQLTERIDEHACLCHRWSSNVSRVRMENLAKERRALEAKAEENRKIRFADICKRLEAQGWGEELETIGKYPYSDLARHPLVLKKTTLTDKGWAAISPKLTQFLEEKRTQRLEIANRVVFHARLEPLKQFVNDFYRNNNLKTAYMPHIVDICCFPEVQELMSGILTVAVTYEDLKRQIEPIFSDLLARWRVIAERQLVARVATQLGPSNDINHLELATATFFRCSKCISLRTYPAVLWHKCLWERQRDNQAADPGSYEGRLFAIYHSQPWSCGVLDLTTRATRVENLIRACGGDPRRTTCSELDAIDPRLACELCHRPGRKVIMTWRTAFDHCMSTHFRAESEDVSWELVSNDEASRARELEVVSDQISRRAYRAESIWICADCSWKGRYDQVEEHRISGHNDASPTEGRDYHHLPDSDPFLLKPVALISEARSETSLQPWEGEWLIEGRAGWYCFPASA